MQGLFLNHNFPCIHRDFSKCRRWDSNPHEVALTGFFESDKDCGMARDAALRGAFMSLLAFLCGIVRVLCVLTVTKTVTKIIAYIYLHRSLARRASGTNAPWPSLTVSGYTA